MSRVRWDLRVDDGLSAWVDVYAEERGVSRTQVVELALKELRALAAGGVPEFKPSIPYRSARAPVRRCFRCRGKDCVLRVFLTMADPLEFVPACPEHGLMVRAENAAYRGAASRG